MVGQELQRHDRQQRKDRFQRGRDVNRFVGLFRNLGVALGRDRDDRAFARAPLRDCMFLQRRAPTMTPGASAETAARPYVPMTSRSAFGTA